MRSRRRFALTAFASVAALVAAVLPVVSETSVADAATSTPGLTVTVSPAATSGTTVPSDFIGLSIEAGTLTSGFLDAAHPGNLVSLFRSLGPGVLRLGGNSVDTMSWQSQDNLVGQPPSWAITELRTADLDRLKTFLDATGWKVVLGLNLGHYDPSAAADEAKTAVAHLGSDLTGLEIGNEPNAYVLGGYRDDGWGAADYQTEITAYKTAIRKVVTGTPLTGPASYPPTFLDAWGQVMAGEGTELTEHLYPLNACGTTAPTVEALLTRATAKRESALIQSGLTSAANAGLKLRLDETNSVICSGFYGVSDVFASSLWAADYLSLAAQAGAAGVNLHNGYLKTCADQLGNQGKAPYYTIFCAPDDAALAAGQFVASPEYYGLQMFAQLRGSRFLPVSISGKQAGSSSAYAVLTPQGTVKVLVIDEATHSADVTHSIAVKLDATWGAATSIGLSGPSPYLADGVTLAGSRVTTDGSFALGAGSKIAGKAGTFTVSVHPGGAALLTVAPACTVPDLRGQIITAATVSLLKNGCTVGKVSKIAAKPGVHARYIVLRQHSKAGSIYGPASKVSFTLAPKVYPKKKPAKKKP